MVWSGFSHNDKTSLDFLGRKRRDQVVLEGNLLPYAPLIPRVNQVFQQVNAAIQVQKIA